MHHALRVDLFHVPQVQSVVWTIELMSRPFPPAVKTDLEAPHVVLAGQHGMQLVPDNALREIQPALLERRRVATAGRLATPCVKRTSPPQDTRHAARPCEERLLELPGTKAVGCQVP